MGFIEQHLTNNEQIVHKGHLHWFAYAGGLSLIVILWAVAMVIIAFNLPEVWAFVAVTLLALLIGYIYVWLVSKNTEYYITSKRLIVKKGIVQRNTSELRLVKCEGVMVEQSMLGRLFNYGTIKITTGEVVNTYQFIASPIRFRTKLNETLDQLDISKNLENNL
jgi:uncharacterized membrane protein YdbT with pleckstrin-like domain